jgi:hypothetical protein
MKLKSLGLTVASIVLSVVYSGCGVVEQKTSTTGSVMKPGVEQEPTVMTAAKPKKKVAVDINNSACTATYDEHSDGTLKKGTLNITGGAGTGSGQCSVEEPNNMTINGFTVLSISPAQFILQGSCRYCYINSAGGMTCILYNVASCP